MCICGMVLDDFGDHLFKCNTIASIITFTQLIVQHEVAQANVGLLRVLQRNTLRRMDRMDLIIACSDSQPTLADVTVTHPSPSNQTSITAAISTPLFFAAKAKGGKIPDILQQSQMFSTGCSHLHLRHLALQKCLLTNS